MNARIVFSVLGPLEVHRGGTVVPILPGKQRALLAALLVDSNRMVLVAEIVEALWGASPPRSARATLQNYVKRLRGTLGDGSHSVIRTLPAGYLIRVAADELDLLRFEALLRSAEQETRAGGWARAAVDLRAALSLWRGEPLADVPSDLLAQREVPRLVEMRLRAMEMLVEADLHFGRLGDVIAELRKLTAIYPLRERLHELLMLALYRDGQQAAALNAYREIRDVLVRELGAEPGPGLRHMQHSILRSDPAPTISQIRADVRNLRPAYSIRSDAVPRQLLAAPRHFSGRTSEIAALMRMLGTDDGGPTQTVAAFLICGMAGVGKTALAMHWAHQVASEFPDGQLYVDLRGYDPDPPVAAADALAGFLRALGVAATDLPAEPDERAALYRTLLAERRVFVLLDNACSAEQVRPLLPGGPGCAAVVTSRESLAGLVARNGAARLELDPLPLADAVEVLRAQIGPRVAADRQSAETLARQCALLPLALRTAGELAAARHDVSLADLVAELAHQRRRLDLLAADGDTRTAVRAVFSWSCRHLDADTVRTFALLGLHPGPDYDRYAVAALIGSTLEDATAQVDWLTRAHLIQPGPPGRYGMHDLLRAYARELSATCCADGEAEVAMTRVFDHYVSSTTSATELLFPAFHAQQPAAGPPQLAAPALTDADAARAWLDAHRPTLLAAVASGAESSWPAQAIRLAAALFRYLEVGGYYSELTTMYGFARHAAQRTDDLAAEAEALNNVSVVGLRQGHLDVAMGHLDSALALYRRLGDHIGQTWVLGNLGIAAFLQGRYQRAIQYQQQALKLHRGADDHTGEARTLNNLGLIDLRQGRYEEAAERFTLARDYFRDLGDRNSEAHCAVNLAAAGTRLGGPQQAISMLQEALATFRETGNPSGETHALSNLGMAELQQGNADLAASHLIAALELARQTRDRAEEAAALNALGMTLLRTGKLEEAKDRHTCALEIARQIGELYEQARAHDGLARCGQATGDVGAARGHWHRSLDLHASLCTPEADQIRRQLAEVG